MKTPNEITMIERNTARREQMLRELQSDLAGLVDAGEMTDAEANEWANRKAAQWFGGDR